MVYLDTHIVVWFYANDKQRFSISIQDLMNRHTWYISPIVQLELKYLHEIGRINPTAETMIADLAQRVGLTVCTEPFHDVIANAMQILWIRDPFDRIIVAHAALNNEMLITSDRTIRANYPYAKW